MYAFSISCCSEYDKSKGGFHGRGTIMKFDNSQHRILIDDKDRGKIWLKLNISHKINKYAEGAILYFGSKIWRRMKRIIRT
jgi:hypothetical protein